MFRSAVASALLASIAGGACAGTSSAPIIIFTPAYQPGNACIPAGVGTSEETRTSKGDPVVTTGVHGAHATRCPDAMFPTLATTEKLPSDAERSTPSAHCVPPRTRVGEDLMIPSYGQATVLELDASNASCPNGVMAKVVGTALHRAAQAQEKPATSATPPAPAYEPTELELQREYDRLVAATAPTQEYHVRHILLRTRTDALAALEQIRTGRSFAEVAAEMSTDGGSQKKGGDLGWHVPSTFVEEFSKGMVDLAPAGLTKEPVKTKFGWHVIELLETKVGKDSIPPYLSVKKHIAARLKTLHRAASAPVRVPAKAVCRNMVAPELPATDGVARAKGIVVAEIRVENGRVTEITKLSGPEEFHAAVTTALKAYECDRLDRPTLATQSFDF